MKSAAQIPNSSLINLTYEEQLALDGSTFVDLTMEERRSGCKVRQGLAVQGSPPANDDGCNLAGAPERSAMLFNRMMVARDLVPKFMTVSRPGAAGALAGQALRTASLRSLGRSACQPCCA